VTNNFRCQLQVRGGTSKARISQAGKVGLLLMTERVKTWVMAVVVMVLLEVIRARHLSIGPQLLWYVLAIFFVSFVLYWLPPREKSILRGWLAFSIVVSMCGALFLVLATK